MIISSAYCNTDAGATQANGHFALLIDIEMAPAQRADIAEGLGRYLEQLRELFHAQPGYLGAELRASDDGRHLLGCVHWASREDWEAAWDCDATRNELFADSLLRLGARSIHFDSFLVAEQLA
ncbi:antibiotic biosynthesis monooxygenase family protein [Pseudomonas citronellolis]|uniref:antibiotic biosynthesis monooxygenase family protein n=1 Tax=Pseudomonas citronellolis TaxID=53408 RepID=UPI0023E3A3E1|nr:antibiotic biosynthesis monooxygenase [Pseudomonas citronellolis]MDF3935939.1 antibiotic biosynthesis monooxygenase [Pseudomonas citronellolis]